MIEELKAVIGKIEQLKSEEQRQIAKLLTDEMNWESTLQGRQDKLEKLAQEAVEEHRSGKTNKTDW